MYRIDNYTKRISLIRGDTLRVSIKIFVDGEEYTPVEGDEVRFALKENFNSSKIAVSKEIPTGTLLLHLLPEDTKDLKFGQYVYDIEITFANGDIDTFITGKFDILPEIV